MTLSPWPDNGEDRQVLFTPAFHRCSPDPRTNFGIGSVRMMWILKHAGGKPTAGAVDWHAPVPTYEGQEQSQSHCMWLDGPCYLDSGFILGDELFDLLRIEGDEAVWARLRELMDARRSEEAARR